MRELNLYFKLLYLNRDYLTSFWANYEKSVALFVIIF